MYTLVAEGAKELRDLGPEVLAVVIQTFGTLIGNQDISLDNRATLVLAAGVRQLPSAGAIRRGAVEV